MTTQTNIEHLIRTFYEAFAGKPALLDGIVSDDWDDIPLNPGQAPGKAGARDLIMGIGQVFDNFHIVVEQIIDGRGDDGAGMVGVRTEMRGVQTGEFFGVAGTGREIAVRTHDFHEIAAGRIVRTWHLEDWMGWFQQVGATAA